MQAACSLLLAPCPMLLACALLCSAARAANQPAGAAHHEQKAAVPSEPTNAAPALEALSVKSVFVDDPQFGKDPFFPKSVRRQPAKPTEPVQTAPDFPDAGLFSVKGISFAEGRRLAIIHDGRRNRTFAEGEEMELKLENRALRFRCVEIREQAVVVSINGAIRELPLPRRAL